MPDKIPVHILYDGACPFCTAFSRMVRLQENYTVELVNAREPHPLVQAATDKGLDLDEGMIVVMDDQFHHGEEAMTRMALMTAKNGGLRRLVKWIFSSPQRSRFFYPALRAGRNFSLKILGHTQIENLAVDQV